MKARWVIPQREHNWTLGTSISLTRLTHNFHALLLIAKGRIMLGYIIKV